MNRRSLALACVASLIACGIARAQDVLDLPVGDPARREKTVAVLLDTLVDTTDGAVLTPAQVAARLEPVDLLFVGESHTSIDFHRAQQSMVEALLDAGRDVMIGAGDVSRNGPGSTRPLERWEAGRRHVPGAVTLVRALGLFLELLPAHLPAGQGPRRAGVRAQRAARCGHGGAPQGARTMSMRRSRRICRHVSIPTVPSTCDCSRPTFPMTTRCTPR